MGPSVSTPRPPAAQLRLPRLLELAVVVVLASVVCVAGQTATPATQDVYGVEDGGPLTASVTIGDSGFLVDARVCMAPRVYPDAAAGFADEPDSPGECVYLDDGAHDIRFTPSPNYAGVAEVRFQFNGNFLTGYDERAAPDGRVFFHLSGVNDPPQVAVTGGVQLVAPEGGDLVIPVTVEDLDQANGTSGQISLELFEGSDAASGRTVWGPQNFVCPSPPPVVCSFSTSMTVAAVAANLSSLVLAVRDGVSVTQVPMNVSVVLAGAPVARTVTSAVAEDARNATISVSVRDGDFGAVALALAGNRTRAGGQVRAAGSGPFLFHNCTLAGSGGGGGGGGAPPCVHNFTLYYDAPAGYAGPDEIDLLTFDNASMAAVNGTISFHAKFVVLPVDDPATPVPLAPESEFSAVSLPLQQPLLVSVQVADQDSASLLVRVEEVYPGSSNVSVSTGAEFWTPCNLTEGGGGACNPVLVPVRASDFGEGVVRLSASSTSPSETATVSWNHTIRVTPQSSSPSSSSSPPNASSPLSPPSSSVGDSSSSPNDLQLALLLLGGSTFLVVLLVLIGVVARQAVQRRRERRPAGTAAAPLPSSSSSASSADDWSSNSASGGTEAELQMWMIDAADLEIGDELARGEFGVVYRGRFNENECVVKRLLLPADGVSDGDSARAEAVRDEFMHEARVLSRVRPHAGLAAFFGIAGVENEGGGGPLSLVYELVEGGALLHLARLAPLRSDDVLSIAGDVASGLAHLHGLGVVHCDVAARNVLVKRPADSAMRGVLCDFGLARLLDNDGSTGYDDEEAVPMPVRWMPPEALMGEPLCPPTDVWSWAVVVWESLSRGRTPYTEIASNLDVVSAVVRGARLRVPPRAPAGLEVLLQRCWADKPSDRPSARSMARAIRQLRSTRAESARGDEEVDSCSSSSSSSSSSGDDGGAPPTNAWAHPYATTATVLRGTGGARYAPSSDPAAAKSAATATTAGEEVPYASTKDVLAASRKK